MPKFSDSIKVGTRMDPGSNPKQMNTIGISGPRSISSSFLKANVVKAPYYQFRGTEQPHWITNKAINDFGETLIDVTMSIADRRARLLADEANRKQKRILEGVLKTNDDAYLLTQELDAIHKREGVVQKIQQVEEATLKGVSNHVKIHLNSEAKATTDWAMQLVADHVFYEQRKATVSAQKGKLEDLQSEVNGYSDMAQVQGRINTVFSGLIFANETERQNTQDAIYMGILDNDIKNLIRPNEDVTNTALDQRVDGIGNKVGVIVPHLSETAKIKAVNLYHKAVDKVEAEKTYRRRKLDRLTKESNLRVANMFAGLRNKGGPFPEAFAKGLKDAGLMDEIDYEREKAHWNKGSSASAASQDATTFIGIQQMINRNAPYNDWFIPLMRAAKGPDPVVSPGQVSTLLSQYESMKDELYRNYLSRLDASIKSWIVTTGFGSEFSRNEEDAMYRKASVEAMTRLQDLKLNNKLNKDEFKIVLDEMEIKYGLDATIRKQNTFVQVPIGSTTVVNSLEDLYGVLTILEQQKADGVIDDITLQNYANRANALMTLFERKRQMQEDVERRKGASETFPGYPEEEGSVNAPITDWEVNQMFERSFPQNSFNDMAH